MRASLLFVALVSLFVGCPAWAQRVVVLELDGDSTGKLRKQIEGGVRDEASCELIPLKKYKDVAATRRLKRAAAMTPVGIARVARSLDLDAAVAGEVVGKSFQVVIYDRAGKELWSKRLAMKSGRLSEDLVAKLSRAITAAAEQGVAQRRAGSGDATGGAGEEAGAQGDDGAAVEPDPGAAPRDARATGKPGGEGAPGAKEGSRFAQSPRDAPVSAPDKGVVVPIERFDESAEARTEERDADLDRDAATAVKEPVGPPLIQFWLAGMTTWRSQCLRPGVTSCAQYDDLEKSKRAPLGKVIDVSATVPYPGVSGELEVFPMARFSNKLAQGVGVLGAFSIGTSLIKVVEGSAQGTGTEKTIGSTDTSWSAQIAWRLHFPLGYGQPQATAFVGARFGLQGRVYAIDPKVPTEVPSSPRFAPTGLGFPVAGVDLSLPLSKYLRVTLSGAYAIQPRPSAVQIASFGNEQDPTGGVQSSGFAADLGFSGAIWGPVGWSVRGRLVSFADRYYGQGSTWDTCNESQCGGAGEERFISVVWGLTVAH